MSGLRYLLLFMGILSGIRGMLSGSDAHLTQTIMILGFLLLDQTLRFEAKR